MKTCRRDGDTLVTEGGLRIFCRNGDRYCRRWSYFINRDAGEYSGTEPRLEPNKEKGSFLTFEKLMICLRNIL